MRGGWFNKLILRLGSCDPLKRGETVGPSDRTAISLTKPIEVLPPPEPAIIVDEIDTSAMTRTGVMKAWDRLTGKFKE